MSDTPGVRHEDTIAATLNLAQASAMIRNRTVTGGMIPKIMSAFRTLRGGRVGKVHLIDGTEKYSLLTEIFTDIGGGTEFVR